MSEGSIPESITDCFLSYEREDNEDLGGIADRIRADLSGLYAAHTGKSLRIFIDRESIGWGQDWAAKDPGKCRTGYCLCPCGDYAVLQ